MRKGLIVLVAELIDTYYSVDRVRALLRLYPYLLDAQPPTDPELRGLAHKTFGPDGWKAEAAAKRADIWRGIVWLEQRSPEAAYILRANIAVGLPLRNLEGYIRRYFHRDVTYETIRCWKDDGLTMMSWYLCHGDA